MSSSLPPAGGATVSAPSIAVPEGGRVASRPRVAEAMRGAAAQTRAHARALALRDATLATATLVASIFAGSRGFRDLDPALLGYLGATLVAAFATSWRASAFWRRPSSAFYGRALLGALSAPRLLRRTVAAAGRDLAAQDFIRRRSLLRWAAHLLLSLGTLASFAITLPLVFGWMRFRPEGERVYRLIAFGVPAMAFDVDGALGWLVFHGLSLAGVAVLLGSAYFLASRLRLRRLAGATSAFAVAPLALLLVVALTGLALPASRGWPAVFPIAAGLHEASVIALLVAMPFSKLSHVLVRPLQLGARAVRARDADWQTCAGCGGALAPAEQRRVVDELLARRGIRLATQVSQCPTCRRKRLAAVQAALVGAHFQPRVLGARPAPLREA